MTTLSIVAYGLALTWVCVIWLGFGMLLLYRLDALPNQLCYQWRFASIWPVTVLWALLRKATCQPTLR